MYSRLLCLMHLQILLTFSLHTAGVVLPWRQTDTQQHDQQLIKHINTGNKHINTFTVPTR